MRNFYKVKKASIPKKPIQEWCPARGEIYVRKIQEKLRSRPKEDHPDILNASPYIRCPVCSRRLKPRIKWHDGGEHHAFDYLEIPRHKQK